MWGRCTLVGRAGRLAVPGAPVRRRRARARGTRAARRRTCCGAGPCGCFLAVARCAILIVAGDPVGLSSLAHRLQCFLTKRKQARGAGEQVYLASVRRNTALLLVAKPQDSRG